MKKTFKMLLIITGTLCVCLGVLGMFLPLLPATPFLLLAAFFYARSSKRFYLWLTTNRFCGEYISHYRKGHDGPAQGTCSDPALADHRFFRIFRCLVLVDPDTADDHCSRSHGPHHTYQDV